MRKLSFIVVVFVLLMGTSLFARGHHGPRGNGPQFGPRCGDGPSTAPAPEPGTLIALGAGAAGVWIANRRKKKQQQ